MIRISMNLLVLSLLLYFIFVVNHLCTESAYMKLVAHNVSSLNWSISFCHEIKVKENENVCMVTVFCQKKKVAITNAAYFYMN